MFDINKKIKSMLYKNPPSKAITLKRPFAKRNAKASSLISFDMKGKQMYGMSATGINIGRMLGKKLNCPSLSKGKTKKDWDGDGIPNRKDCQPNNIMRQDSKPNLLLRQRIDSLPIYYSTKDYSEDFDGVHSLGPHIDEMEKSKREGVFIHLTDKRFPKEEKRNIYSTFKKYPNLIGSTQKSKSDIIYVDDKKYGWHQPSDTKGFNWPRVENNKLSSVGIVITKQDGKFRKDNTAEILFHETKHSEQNLEMPVEQYKQKRIKALKYGYINEPDEIEARKHQIQKIEERVGADKADFFRRREELNLDLYQQVKDGKLSREEADKIKADFENEYK